MAIDTPLCRSPSHAFLLPAVVMRINNCDVPGAACYGIQAYRWTLFYKSGQNNIELACMVESCYTCMPHPIVQFTT